MDKKGGGYGLALRLRQHVVIRDISEGGELVFDPRVIRDQCVNRHFCVIIRKLLSVVE